MKGTGKGLCSEVNLNDDYDDDDILYKKFLYFQLQAASFEKQKKQTNSMEFVDDIRFLMHASA